ncbi:MAG: hypothetical protein RL215_1180 [Planctomycetota bacterium]
MIEGLGPVAGTFAGIGFTARPADESALEVSEDGEIDFVGGAVVCEEVLESAFVVVGIGEFEDGFAEVFGEPDDSAADEERVPGDVGDEPWGADAGEIGSGRHIEQEFGVGMLLERGGGNGWSHRAFDGSGDDAGFIFAEGEDEDASGFEDGTDPHGDCSARNILCAEEIAGGVRASDGVERDHAGASGEIGARFVEADVTSASDTKNLNVDAAGGRDSTFVFAAVISDAIHRYGAIGHVGLSFGDVNVIEEMFLHEPDVALHVFGLHGVVFVKVEGDHVAEGEAFFAVEPDQFGIDTGRG